MYSLPSDVSLATAPTREPSDNALFRTASGRQKKLQSAQFYKEITATLNSKMADFMSHAHGSDDEDDDSFKEEMMKHIGQVKSMLREETRVREAVEQNFHERFQRLELSCSAAQSNYPSLHDAKLAVSQLHERMDNFSDVLRAASERLTREMTDARHATSLLDQRVGTGLALAQAKITACERRVTALGREAQDIQSMLAEKLGQPVEKALLVANERTRELERLHNGMVRSLVDSPEASPSLSISGSSAVVASRASRASRWWDPGADADQNCGSQVGTSVMQDAMLSKLQACERQCSKLEEHCTDLVQRVANIELGFQSVDKRGSFPVDTDLSVQVRELTDVVGTEAQVRARHDQSVQECFKELERRFCLQDEKTKCTEDQLQELMSFKESHSQDAEELKNLKDCFEGALYEVTRNTASELKSTRDEIDQVFSVLTAVQQSWAARPVFLPSEE